MHRQQQETESMCTIEIIRISVQFKGTDDATAFAARFGVRAASIDPFC
jgi:hypothetical protein